MGSVLSPVFTPEGSYVNHTNFDVYNNAEFIERATNESWPGAGTSADPYIIQGYEFILGKGQSAIRIRDVTLNFTIRDCLMNAKTSGEFFDVSVYFINIQNALVENVVTRGSKTAFAVEQCDNITIKGCDIAQLGDAPGIFAIETNLLTLENDTITGGLIGAFLGGCSQVLVENSKFNGSEFMALWDADSQNITVKNCKAESTALLFPYSRQQMDEFTLIGDNRENGLPILLLKDKDLNGSIISSGYGLYLLFNVSNGSLQGIRTPYSNYQILMSGCSDLAVKDVILIAKKIPIVVYACERVIINDISVSSGLYGVGIYMTLSERCAILNSTAQFFTMGILLDMTKDSIVRDCNLTICAYGLTLWPGSNDNRIIGNTFYMNLVYGVQLWGEHNLVLSNTFNKNSYQADNPDDPWCPQAADNGTDNIWNTSRANGGFGNYWPGFESPVHNGIYDNPVPIVAESQNPEVVHNDSYGLAIAPSKPEAPSNLTFSLIGNNVMLSWKIPPVTGGSRIAEYVVYRASSSTGWTELARVSGPAYADNGTAPGSSYLYKVAAINILGEGDTAKEVIVPIPSSAEPTNDWIIAILAIALLMMTLLAIIIWRFK